MIYKQASLYLFSIAFLIMTLLVGAYPYSAHAQATCSGEFISVGTPLNDLGSNEYIRLDGTLTGFTGGLYPNGSNLRPPAHEAAGVLIANQIAPLDPSGNFDPTNGKIVMISVGMSNTLKEFTEFVTQANTDLDINPQLIVVNGAQSGKAANAWLDPNALAWEHLDQKLGKVNVTPQQVQVAWVKQAQMGSGDFPDKALSLQNNLEVIAKNLIVRYPNLKLAYFSSRTRAYAYWEGLSPEPIAFETGFAVKWMIEKQLNGDPELNFNSALGPVVAPYLTWGPYLWADGLNPRSDGLVWTQADLVQDCIHPSNNGIQKVADQLILYFKTDTTSMPWFLAETLPSPTATSVYLPLITKF